MGNSASTSAKIPAELQPLYRNTGRTATALQNYYANPNLFANASNFSGEMPWVTGGSDYFPYSYFNTGGHTPRRRLTSSSGGGQGGDAAAAGGLGGTDPVMAPAPGLRLYQDPGTVEPTNWAGGGWYRDENGALTQDPQWSGISMNPSVVFGFHPLSVAELTPWEEYAGYRAAQLTTDPAVEAQARGWSASMLGEAGIAPQLSLADPSISQAMDVWNRYSGESLRNQMNVMGLGSSTDKGAALAGGQAQVILDALNAQRTSQENAANRKMQAYQAGIGTLMEQGGRQRQSYLDFIKEMRNQGALDRQLEDAQNQAVQNEILRQQGLAEESVYTPLGGFLPSALGSTTKSSGLFK